MIDSHFFLLEPRLYKNKIYIYPPSVRQVATNDLFGYFLKILTLSQEEIEDEYVEKNIEDEVPDPFDFLLMSCKSDKSYEILTKEAFKFFCHTEITFLYDIKKILIGNIETLLKENKNLNELNFLEKEDYFDFQNLIRTSIAEDLVERPNPDEDPRVKKIKAKARYRDKIKAKKQSGLSMSASLASICCMGFGITPLNIGEMSYVSFKAIMNMYQDKEKYDLDIKSLLAGADSKKIKPKFWIKNFE